MTPLDAIIGVQVLIDGLDLQSISIKYLRSQIGLVGQEPVMFRCVADILNEHGIPRSAEPL